MEQSFFLNSQEMTVDAKFRVGIPERFMRTLKKICPDHADEIGVMASPDRSIKLMPYPTFMKELEALAKLDDRLSDQRMMLNMTAPFADLLPMDAQNRIKLAPALCGFCNIKRDVIIVGAMRFMKIFDLAVWNDLTSKGMTGFGGATESVAAKASEPAPVQFVIQAQKGPGNEA